MKQFAFKLQTALDLKLKEEEIRKEELSQATRLYKDSLAVLKALRNRLAEVQHMLRGKQAARLDIAEIRGINDYLPVLEERIGKQREIAEELRRAMEQARQKLVETMKERKMLEKLRDRQYRDYLQECLREEQKQIDEMAIIGYMHKDSAM